MRLAKHKLKYCIAHVAEFAVLVFLVMLPGLAIAQDRAAASRPVEWHAQLGVFITPVDAALARDLRLTESVADAGVITGVAEASAARDAGLQRGDVLLQLGRVQALKTPGQTESLTILRQNQRLTKAVTTRELKQDDAVLLAGFASRAQPLTITVDAGGKGQYRTIAAALTMAAPGDRVVIENGVYREEIVVPPGVTLEAQEVGGARIEGRIPLQVHGANDVAIRGLSLRGTKCALRAVKAKNIELAVLRIDAEQGAGIEARFSTGVAIRGCSLRGNHKAAGVQLWQSESVVSDCMISACRAAIVPTMGGRAEIKNNLLDANRFGVSPHDVEVVVENNAITGRGTNDGAGVLAIQGRATIHTNVIRNCQWGISGARLQGQIAANTLANNGTGIKLAPSAVLVQGNTLLDNETGIALTEEEVSEVDVPRTRIVQNRIARSRWSGIDLDTGDADVLYNIIEGGVWGVTIDKADADVANNTIVLTTLSIDVQSEYASVALYNNIVAFNRNGIIVHAKAGRESGSNVLFGNFSSRKFPLTDGNYVRRDRVLLSDGSTLEATIQPALDLKASDDLLVDPEFVSLGSDYRPAAASPLANKPGRETPFIGALPPVDQPPPNTLAAPTRAGGSEPKISARDYRISQILLKEGRPACTQEQAEAYFQEIVPLVEKLAGRKFRQAPRWKLAERQEVIESLVPELKRQYVMLMPNASSEQRSLKAASEASRQVTGLLGKYGTLDKTLYLLPKNIPNAFRVDGIHYRHVPAVVKLLIAHELTHALQDEAIGLAGRFESFDNPDALFAFNAVVEGQAMFVQEQVAQELSLEEAQAELMRAQGTQSYGSLNVESRMRTQMQQDIYLKGRSFVEFHFKQGGAERIWQILAAPPTQTAMIFKPETYSPAPTTKTGADYASVLQGLERFLPGQWKVLAPGVVWPAIEQRAHFEPLGAEQRDEITAEIEQAVQFVAQDTTKVVKVTLAVLKSPAGARVVIRGEEGRMQQVFARGLERMGFPLDVTPPQDSAVVPGDIVRVTSFVGRNDKGISGRLLQVARGRVLCGVQDVNTTLPDEKLKEVIEEVFQRVEQVEAAAAKAIAESPTPTASPTVPSAAPLEDTITNSIGMKLKLIPAGRFKMGSELSYEEVEQKFGALVADKNEYPLHEVEITLPYYLGVYEVTKSQFRQFVEATSYQTDSERDGKGAAGWTPENTEFKLFGIAPHFSVSPRFSWKYWGVNQSDESPVVNVSWNDAVAFCEWLSNKEGKTYRLPTEAEWEYACRAGTTTLYSFGDDPQQLTDHANVKDATAKKLLTRWFGFEITTEDGYALTAPVGRYRPNPFGLYDMLGNVREWCSDRFDFLENYYETSPAHDPQGPEDGEHRVHRGGDWASSPGYCRSAHRSMSLPNESSMYGGFRIVCEAPAVAAADTVATTSTSDTPAPIPAPAAPSAAPAQETITNSIGMKLRLIPAGEFLMGSPESELGYDDKHDNSESPQHHVRITRPFYLGVYEVTQGEYEEVISSNPSYFSPAGEGAASVKGFSTGRFPVEQVSYEDAIAFCAALNRKEGQRYRLPTEAEWEYACRAGTTGPFHFGDELNGQQANCDGKFPYGTTEKGPDLVQTATVGTYGPNAFGLYDMHGNVSEWCQDAFDYGYYATSPAQDPPGPTSSGSRVVRGGDWADNPAFCRSAHRDFYTPTMTALTIGFRVVREVTPAELAGADTATTTAAPVAPPATEPPSPSAQTPVAYAQALDGFEKLLGETYKVKDAARAWPALEQLVYFERLNDERRDAAVGATERLVHWSAESGANSFSVDLTILKSPDQQRSVIEGREAIFQLNYVEGMRRLGQSMTVTGPADFPAIPGDVVRKLLVVNQETPASQIALVQVARGKVVCSFSILNANLPDAQLRELADEVFRRIEQREPQAAAPLQETITNSIGMKLRLIPAGEFLMGSPESELGYDNKHSESESPQHRVRITRPFYIGVYEVTQSEYAQVIGSNPSWFSSEGKGATLVQGVSPDRFPVEQVSWDDAVAFCAALSRKEGQRYRLPTEAEWEYACRAGTTSAYSTGDSLKEDDANFKSKLYRSAGVGSYAPNALGLFDMHGNVSEWCQDWYESNYYVDSPSQDPQGPEKGDIRVVRGGNWSDHASYCRSAARSLYIPSTRSLAIGFRVVREVPSAEAAGSATVSVPESSDTPSPLSTAPPVEQESSTLVGTPDLSDAPAAKNTEVPDEAVPTDTCVIKLTAPEGATVTVDGRDYGTKRTFTFAGLKPEQAVVSLLKIHLPGGGEAVRTVPLVPGQTMITSAAAPSQIVFWGAGQTSQSRGLYSIQPDGSRGKFLASVLPNGATRISPDGSWIALGGIGGDPAEIWVCKFDGSDLRMLVSGTPKSRSIPTVLGSNSFDWLPDNRQLAVAFTSKLVDLVDVISGKRKQLAEGESPAVSPDGRWLVTTRTAASPAREELVIWPIEGGSARVLAEGRDAVWSPDGQKLAFVRRRTERKADKDTDYFDLYLMRADGSEQRQITENVVTFTWSPDARQLAYGVAGDGSLHMVDADGRAPRAFDIGAPRGQAAAAVVMWPETFCWSPDGKQVVIERGFLELDEEEDIDTTALVLINADGTGLKKFIPWKGDFQCPDWR